MPPHRHERAASAPDDPHCSYQTVMCQACGRLHCINRSTGKLLGANDP
jgi:hypothetical protein